MKASEQLRKPENWQDFEKLCLKLWGAIWNKPEEIELNSSNSQGQAGVDIYCRVDEENGYIGIQCKSLKDERLNGKTNTINLSDIKKEIAKAEEFEPVLKRYIIATSAEKDGEIQKAVRIINEERIAQRKFPVEIKFWDYIAMKVDEHKSVHDWYMKSQNFKSTQSIKFTFSDNSEVITASPIFIKPCKMFVYKKTPNPFEGILKMQQSILATMPRKKYNHSFVKVRFKIKNTGELPIENWKIKITIEDNYNEISDTKIIEDDSIYAIIPNYKPYTNFRINTTKPQILLFKGSINDILVRNDEYIFTELFIKPIPIKGESSIVFNWELLSKDYNDNGKLILNLNSSLRRQYTEVVVDKSITPLPDFEVGDFEDYISSNEEVDSY